MRFPRHITGAVRCVSHRVTVVDRLYFVCPTGDQKEKTCASRYNLPKCSCEICLPEESLFLDGIDDTMGNCLQSLLHPVGAQSKGAPDSVPAEPAHQVMVATRV